MFKVVAHYLVSGEVKSNYYNRSSGSAPIVTNFSDVDETTELVIFDDTVEDVSLKLIDPSLSLSDNSAGSFEFTMPKNNVGYDRLGRMISEIIVYQNNKEIWRGRILSEEMDFYNRKKYYCEGELAYLNDTMVEPCDYKDYDIGTLVRQIIDSHNNQLYDQNTGAAKYPGLDKRFTIGAIEIHNTKNNEDFVKDADFTTNYEKTLEVLNNIVDKFKGHIHIRHQDGKRYLDILDDLKTQTMAGQTINFGANLIDFTRSFDMSSICTAVLALGKLPDDFKPKDQELGSHSGAFDILTTEFLQDVALSRWIDGFGLYNVSDFYVTRSIPITPGAKVGISCRLPNGMVAMSYVDQNNNFISNVKHDGSQWVGKEFSVPNNCTSMSIASYGAPASCWLLPGQEKEIKVPTGADQSAVANNPNACNQIINRAGFDVGADGQSTLIDLTGAQDPNSYLTYNNTVGNNGTQYVDNRERYVTYTEYPTMGSGIDVANSIIEDRNIISEGLHINTIKINVVRDKVDEEVKYIYKARMDYPFMVYAILDEGGAIIDSKTVTEIAEKDKKHNDFIDEIITVPPRGVTLYVSSQVNGDNGGVFDFHVWSYNKLYDKVSMYLTVEEVNDGNAYVVNEDAIPTYGWIAKSIEFDVEDKPTLLSKAKQYLQEIQFDKLEISLNAADLAYISSSVRSFEMYEVVRCVSAPHGLDAKFPITAIELPLDKPDQIQYTLGDTYEPDYTEASNDRELDLVDIINKIPSRESVLVEARRNATEIMNRYCHGHVTIVEDDPRFGSAIYISDSEDYQHSNHQWVWNLNGLGFSRDGGATFETAITMDGSIVADFITAGTMNADRIRSGLLIDLEGKNYWNLETGDIALGLNLKTTKIQNADSYYGNENGNTYPTSNPDIELGSWIYDRTSHDHNFRSMFGSGVNLIDGMYGFSGPVKDAEGKTVMEDWYNPKTGIIEQREKQRYWLYISASMISTGILKGKNGRLWFDLNTGSLWVAGPSRLELNPDGEVLYPDGSGGWTLEPSDIEKHIKFEEGALFGYSGSKWSPETVYYYDVGEDYSTKDQSMADIDHDQKGRHRIFTTGNMQVGTCEGFLDLVSTYGEKDGQKQYDVLLAGSNRVHINFGQSLLIGQGKNLWDIDPKILVTTHDGNFAVGDPLRPGDEYRVNLEVYGDAKIGHKLEEVNVEERGAIGSSGSAPNKELADKYKGDLVVNGSATFGRNYYTEEVQQTNSSVTSSAATQQSGDYTIATGTNQNPAGNSVVTKKVYYDDVNFYANVHIDGEGGLDTDHLRVGYNAQVGTNFDSNPSSHWDNSWKFLNQAESYSTDKTYNDNSANLSTNADDFNAISGDLLVNGRVQFVGGTVGLPDGRLVIASRESGTSGKFSVPLGYTERNGRQKQLMKNYYNIIGPSTGVSNYDINGNRFVVEGNSLLFGDVNILKGDLFTESFRIRQFIPYEDSQSSSQSTGFYHDVALDYQAYYKRFTVYKPMIFTDKSDAVYNEDWRTSYGAIPHALYMDEEIPLTINSGIYYEGNDKKDGLIISAMNERNTLGHSQRDAASKKITLKGDIFTEDGKFYFTTPLYYVGNSEDGLVIDSTLSTNPKTGETRSAESKKVTFITDVYIKSDKLVKAKLYNDGKIEARCLDVTGFAANEKIANNSNYLVGEGEIDAKYLYIFGTNQNVNGSTDRGRQLSISDSGVITFNSGLTLGRVKAICGTDSDLSYTPLAVSGGGLKVPYLDATDYTNTPHAGTNGTVYARMIKLYNSISKQPYAILDGSDGSVSCRYLKIIRLDTNNGAITNTWKVFDYYSKSVNGQTVYMIKLSIDGVEISDYLKINGKNISTASKSLYGYESSSYTLMTFSGGIAPSYIDCTGYSNFWCGATTGYVYAKALSIFYGNNPSLMAMIDTSGNIGGYQFKIRKTANDGKVSWDTVISSSGKGYFDGIQSTGNVSITDSKTLTVSGNTSLAALSCTSLKINNSDISNIFAAKNHTHSEYASVNHTHTGYASVNHTHSGYLTYSDLSGVAYTGSSSNWGSDLNAWNLCTGGVARIDYYGNTNINISTGSDKRLKKNIEDFDKSATDIINSVAVKSFEWKADDKKVLAGFIAQDIQKLDELYETKDNITSFVHKDQDGYLGYRPISLIPILWKAVQELSQEVKDLKEALKHADDK